MPEWVGDVWVCECHFGPNGRPTFHIDKLADTLATNDIHVGRGWHPGYVPFALCRTVEEAQNICGRMKNKQRMLAELKGRWRHTEKFLIEKGRTMNAQEREQTEDRVIGSYRIEIPVERGSKDDFIKDLCGLSEPDEGARAEQELQQDVDAYGEALREKDFVAMANLAGRLINRHTDTYPDVDLALDDQRFGVCPQCYRTDGYLNVGRNHWFVCDSHKTKWCIGSNLFSSWKEESEETWRENAAKLKDYEEVKAIDFLPQGFSVADSHEDESALPELVAKI